MVGTIESYQYVNFNCKPRVKCLLNFSVPALCVFVSVDDFTASLLRYGATVIDSDVTRCGFAIVCTGQQRMVRDGQRLIQHFGKCTDFSHKHYVKIPICVIQPMFKKVGIL